MLVARRDPPLYSGAHDVSHISGHHAAHAPHATRFMTALQMIGSVLAIPVGLASGYSIYHANFSPEARCQSLRGSIISMLDKSADASTLRMLVRRDVAAFEGACGAVDPDAVAAFKTLLAGGTATAPSRTVAPVKQAAHELVHQPNAAAKPEPAKTARAVAEVKPGRRATAASDANWVASVREALMHSAAARAEAAEGPAATPAPAAVRSLAPPIRVPRETRAPALSLAPPASAPALPPAPSVVVAPAPAPASDHPVPPVPIPEAAPLPKPADAASGQSRSGVAGLIAQIPLLGRVIGR
jgi:hypothetical protein